MASVVPGTGLSIEEASGVPTRPPPPLSEEDFARVKAAVRSRHEPRSMTLSSLPTASHEKGEGSSPPVSASQAAGAVGNSGGSGDVEDASVGVSGGIDQRLFAPVLRAILAGEGDHVLRRSLLCHPFLKGSKNGASSAGVSSGSSGSKGSGAGTAPSPVGTSRKKGSKAPKGVKSKKRDRDKDKGNKEQEENGQGVVVSGGTVSPLTSYAKGSSVADLPLDVSREMNRLAERASGDGSLQSTLIFVKTLLCSVDPAAQLTSAVDSSSPNQPQGGRSSGRKHISTSGDDSTSVVRPSSTKILLSSAPLQALAGRGLSGWTEVVELLKREKHRERMLTLRGRPSLTVCCGKADIRGRLEAKGESSGVVTSVQVRQCRSMCGGQTRFVECSPFVFS